MVLDYHLRANLTFLDKQSDSSEYLTQNVSQLIDGLSIHICLLFSQFEVYKLAVNDKIVKNFRLLGHALYFNLFLRLKHLVQDLYGFFYLNKLRNYQKLPFCYPI